MKFAHLADCHLGGWRQPELRELNLLSFKKAIERCIQEKVEFVLIAGDLFDSAYPPMDILEETFFQLKKLKDSGISCYIIAGSHDYSASGKTFLKILETAGFCRNIYNPEQKPGAEKKEDKNLPEIFLNPVIHKNSALYGYPGKKTGLEVSELKKIKLQKSPGFFRIFALHTCIEDAVGNLPIESIKREELPEAEYYALGHLHINFKKDNFVYAGPTFPNNFQEIEELNYGSFYIIETYPAMKIRRQEIKLKEVEVLNMKITNALTATEKIISELSKKQLKDKILLLKISGKLEQGKTSNIKFQEIEDFAKQRGAYAVLKSTSKLVAEQAELNIEIEDMNKLESEIIEKYKQQNISENNKFILPLINSLSLEKQEAETTTTFKNRLFGELNKILNLDMNAENEN